MSDDVRVFGPDLAGRLLTGPRCLGSIHATWEAAKVQRSGDPEPQCSRVGTFDGFCYQHRNQQTRSSASTNVFRCTENHGSER